MTRITKKLLQAHIDTINSIIGMPETPYTRTNDKLFANIGNFYLSKAYRGYCVHRICNEHGAVVTPIWDGNVSAREAYERLSAFIRGLTFTR